jgi:hypothetical protein
MFIVPNTMLMNVMACRVFRNTRFCAKRMDPTIAVSSMAFQETDPNSSATHAPALVSETDNQDREGAGGVVAGGKLEHGDVIEIYPSHKIISIQDDHDQAYSAV